MFKKVVLAATFLLVAAAIFNTKTSQVSAKQEEKVRICHRTNSAVNPYNSIEVDVSAVDGAGANDHTHHTGPVFDPEVHTQQNRGWGDIIPDMNGATPLNWPDGQSIWDNDCNIPTVVDQAVIVFDVDCVIDGNDASVKVTFTNFGDVNGTAKLNGEDVQVDAGQTVVKELQAGTNISIDIDNEPVYNQTPECEVPQDDDEDGEVLASEDQKPTGGVNAGSGAMANNTAAIVGVVVSLSAVSAGAILRKKFN